MHTLASAFLLLFLVAGCQAASASTATTEARTTTSAEVRRDPLPAVTAVYPWQPSATDRLDARFETPHGFKRVDNPEGTFGAFLRTLPLLPEGTPVVDYRGRPLYSNGRHPGIVAVVDLDIGDKDLQHCADVIVRVHGEWRFGRGERDLSYRAVSGQVLSYRAFAAGDRAVPHGTRITMERRAAPHDADDHVFFREWMTDVFNWVGTASLERDAAAVKGGIADVKPGDFFVKSGSPYGHSVLILDVARDDQGRTALLLGQSFMPAQSFQVLKPTSSSSPWFIVEPGDIAVDTPFWPAFPMTTLRRLD